MKRLLLIILLLFFCVSIVAVAKLKFGSWDKWDEELPPPENESWHVNSSQPERNQPVMKGTWTNFSDSGNDVVFLFSDFYFYGDKKGKTKASALFYTSWKGDADKEDWVIQDACLVLIAFPPEKKKMMIRAYVKEDQVFKFFEEWKIVFKDHKIVVPKEVKFYKFFEGWLEKVCSRKIIPEDMIDFMIPELKRFKKGEFVITEGPKEDLNLQK